MEHGTLHNPLNQAEQTAEIPQPEVTSPSFDLSDETTGVTGRTDDVPIQASVMNGLLWATVIGMIGAAVMLLAVWLIIDGVF